MKLIIAALLILFGVLVFIMFLCAMAAGIITTKIDKYWHPRPENLSPYAGHQINRFMGYGHDLLLGRPVLRPVPWYVRLWVVGTFIFVIIFSIAALIIYFTGAAS
ncbi:MAG: hypothetical protein ACRC6D_13565 [Aeromonas sp.]